MRNKFEISIRSADTTISQGKEHHSPETILAPDCCPWPQRPPAKVLKPGTKSVPFVFCSYNLFVQLYNRKKGGWGGTAAQPLDRCAPHLSGGKHKNTNNSKNNKTPKQKYKYQNNTDTNDKKYKYK